MSVPLHQPLHPNYNSRPVYDMALPFDPNSLTGNAISRGLPRQEAAVFAHLALQQLRTLQAQQIGRPVSIQQVADAIKRQSAAHVAREDMTQAKLQEFGVSISDQMEYELNKFAGLVDNSEGGRTTTIEAREASGVKNKRFKFSSDGLDEFFEGQDPYDMEKEMAKLSLKHTSRDIITALCHHVELAVELGKHLPPTDIISLYRANRAFHDAVNSHLLSSIRAWIRYNAPEAGQIFSFKLYRRFLVPDPSGRTWGEQYEGASYKLPLQRRDQVRSVPGLKYLQLVLGRDRCCRQIIAIMARNGHRMPDSMYSTLLRLWLLMEVSTTAQRQALLKNEVMWPERDLYNAQFLFIKLGMHFNDPMFGPNKNDLLTLFMGQKGLYPLWQLLLAKKFTTLSEFMELKSRYDTELPPDHWGQNYFEQTVYGVRFEEVGIGHCEGWGHGTKHLMRPDELIPIEAVMRGLDLDDHLMNMVTWGYIDWDTGANLVPTEEEMHISDEEDTLAKVDTSHHWKRKHALKKRWETLKPEQQKDIIADDEDERLRAQAWCGDNLDDYSSDEDPQPYSLDDEINRGYVMRPQAKDKPSTAPPLNDQNAWNDFVNSALVGMPADISEDQQLRAQSLQTYERSDFQDGRDWLKWLREHDERTEAMRMAAQFVFDEEDEADDEDEDDDGSDDENMDDGEDDYEQRFLDDGYASDYAREVHFDQGNNYGDDDDSPWASDWDEVKQEMYDAIIEAEELAFKQA
ncbi:hypothetical protein G7046_g2052 [Stylonectria norvegica]|nr:hypothetical protein G7046_g2052 [Stylonectria norvegica]